MTDPVQVEVIENHNTVPKTLIRGYITALFILVMVAFATTMTVVIHYERQDTERARVIAQRVSDEATRNKLALCTFRQDLATRAENTKNFLKDHPEGIPGIPVAVIEQGLTNQEATIKSLAILKCD